MSGRISGPFEGPLPAPDGAPGEIRKGLLLVMDQFPPERGEELEEMQGWVHPVMNPIPRQASPSHPLKGMASEQLQHAVGGTDLCLCPCQP